jgi:hypothetical protein
MNFGNKLSVFFNFIIEIYIRFGFRFDNLLEAFDLKIVLFETADLILI